MDKETYISKQRAEHQKAEKFADYSDYAQYAVMAFTIISLFFSANIVLYLLSFISFFVTVCWISFKYISQQTKGRAEKLRRFILYWDGLGVEPGGKYVSDILFNLSSNEEQARQWTDDNYYASNSMSSLRRTAELLEESAFWSTHLYQKQFKKNMLAAAAALTAIIILFFVATLLPNLETTYTILHVVLAGVCLLTSSEKGYDLIILNQTKTAIDEILTTVELLLKTEQSSQSVLLLMQDYNVILSQAPIIHTKIYNAQKDRLNLLWKEYKNIS